MMSSFPALFRHRALSHPQSRRRLLQAATSAIALPFVPCLAQAEAYPSRPVRLVVPFPAGGVSDIVGRLVGQWLSERLGQPFVIEDRGGAGSNLGTEVVVNAAPDGYTLRAMREIG
jgi:tripartite-type tricarboxylate transporter receptor subunit TctC